MAGNPGSGGKQKLYPSAAAALEGVVADGQTLLVLEAMKMRNDLKAQRAGVVPRIEVQAGDQVRHGDVLLELGD